MGWHCACANSPTENGLGQRLRLRLGLGLQLGLALGLAHGLALDCNQMWARQGDVGEGEGSLVFIAKAPCWTWELQRALGGLQKYLNEDLLLLYLWLITNLMAVEKAG